MTHEELLADIDTKILLSEHTIYPIYMQAFRAVVELHTAFTPEFGGGIDYCWADDRPYPCPTIQAIEKELR